MRISLAARFGRRDELRGYRTALQSLGHEVFSSWLDAPDETAEADWTAAAQRDLVEIFDADLLIAFTDDGVGSGRGGHHAEFGAALTAATFWPTAWATKWPWIVGPRQHVLHFHPGVRHFATWADALAALTTGTREQADGFSPADWIDQ